jgi:hypothetical protein
VFKFIRSNVVLTIGVLLPILMIVFFALSQSVPKFFVEPPKYNFVYAAPYYGNLQFKFVDKKLFVEFSCQNLSNDPLWLKRTSLYVFDVKTKKAAQTLIDFSRYETQCKNQHYLLLIPAFNQYRIDSSTLSPDGYQLSKENQDYMLFDLLNRNTADGLFISKNGNRMGVHSPAPKFIGWIVGKSDEHK